jgi:hypothetical protein
MGKISSMLRLSQVFESFNIDDRLEKARVLGPPESLSYKAGSAFLPTSCTTISRIPMKMKKVELKS